MIGMFIAAAAGSLNYGEQFIRRAHLEVLKQEDIEDQLLTKKIADIICSPRRLKQAANSFYQNRSFANSKQGAGTPSKNSQRSGGPYLPPQILKNTYVREHFWSNEFIKNL